MCHWYVPDEGANGTTTHVLHKYLASLTLLKYTSAALSGQRTQTRGDIPEKGGIPRSK